MSNKLIQTLVTRNFFKAMVNHYVGLLRGLEVVISGPCTQQRGRLVWREEGKNRPKKIFGKTVPFPALMKQWKKKFRSDYKYCLKKKMGYKQWKSRYHGRRLTSREKVNIKYETT